MASDLVKVYAFYEQYPHLKKYFGEYQSKKNLVVATESVDENLLAYEKSEKDSVTKGIFFDGAGRKLAMLGEISWRIFGGWIRFDANTQNVLEVIRQLGKEAELVRSIAIYRVVLKSGLGTNTYEVPHLTAHIMPREITLPQLILALDAKREGGGVGKELIEAGDLTVPVKWATRVCATCGAINPDNQRVRFCRRCGANPDRVDVEKRQL
jgi:ribosomal protein L40E